MSSRLRLLAPVLALTFVVAACGAGTSPTPAASNPPPASTAPAASAAPGASAICDDAAAFRASVAALTDLKLLEVGTSGVKAALTNVSTSAKALLVSGKDLLAQPLAKLLAAVEGLQATISALGDQPGLGAAVASIRTAIAGIKAAAADVETALGTTCPTR